MSVDLMERFCFNFERMKSLTSTLSVCGAAEWKLGLDGRCVMVLLNVEIYVGYDGLNVELVLDGRSMFSA